jgi:hypothetical protein
VPWKNFQRKLPNESLGNSISRRELYVFGMVKSLDVNITVEEIRAENVAVHLYVYMVSKNYDVLNVVAVKFVFTTRDDQNVENVVEDLYVLMELKNHNAENVVAVRYVNMVDSALFVKNVMADTTVHMAN